MFIYNFHVHNCMFSKSESCVISLTVLITFVAFSQVLLTRNDIQLGDTKLDINCKNDQESLRLSLYNNLDGVDRFIVKHLDADLEFKEDFEHLGDRMRLLKSLWRKNSATQSIAAEVMMDRVFPWLRDRSKILDQASSRDKGIVMTIGNNFVTTGMQTIRALQQLNSALPVVVFYAGVFDLANENVHKLVRLPGVELVNLCDLLNCTTLDMDKWDTKPFALLASPFKETILMDADAIFVQNPAILFKDPGYILTGAVLFKDRTLFGGPSHTANWLKRVLPKPISERAQATRMYHGQTIHEVESGVVVMDKEKHIFGLLTICLLNMGTFKEEMHTWTHGDKESFWIGLEIIGEPYEIHPELPGSIGSIDRSVDERLCHGHLAHFDREGRLLWFNDGLAQAKRDDDDWGLGLAASFDHYGREGEWSELLCLSSLILPIPEDLQETIQELQHINNLKRIH